MDSLNGINAFVRTAETLSFVAAGRILGISASAVGKNVAKLEHGLGVRLFQRSTRRISLTEAGALFYERCRRILDDLQDAEAMLSEVTQVPRGILRISLPIIGYRFLLPILPEFKKRYPEIEMDIDFNDRIIDVIETGFDAVIRSGELVDSSLMARKVGVYRCMLCASPEYLQRKGIPYSPEALSSHECIRFRFPTTGKLQQWDLWEKTLERTLHLPTTLTCNNMEALRAATMAGFGLAYLPDFLVRDALASGDLQIVLGEYFGMVGQFSILWPSNRHLSPKLRVFVDFCCEKMFMENS